MLLTYTLASRASEICFLDIKYLDGTHQDMCSSLIETQKIVKKVKPETQSSSFTNSNMIQTHNHLVPKQLLGI